MSAAWHTQALILSRRQMFLIFHIANFISFLFYDTLTQEDHTSEKGKSKDWDFNEEPCDRQIKNQI